jgi:prolyl-tRNA synthetase
MFKIEFEAEDGGKQFAWQNSWGLSTRTIGVMVMVHGDDKVEPVPCPVPDDRARMACAAGRHAHNQADSCGYCPLSVCEQPSSQAAAFKRARGWADEDALCVQGLVMPPRVAPVQVVVIPIPSANLTDEQRSKLDEKTRELVQALVAAGVRLHCDDRDNYRPGWKYNHWEVKVLPLVHAPYLPPQICTCRIAFCSGCHYVKTVRCTTETCFLTSLALHLAKAAGRAFP